MNNTYNLNNYLESNEEFPVIIIGEDVFTVIDTVENKLEFQKQVAKNPNDLMALYTIAFGSKEKAQKLKELIEKNPLIFQMILTEYKGISFTDKRGYLNIEQEGTIEETLIKKIIIKQLDLCFKFR